MFLSFSEHKSTYLAMTCLLFSGYSFAESAPNEGSSVSANEVLIDPDTKQGWSSEISVGFSSSTGNTDNKSSTLSAAITHNKLRLKYALGGSLAFAENKGVKTEEDSKLWSKIDYAITNKNHIFNLFVYNHKKFANVDSSIFDVVGYAQRLIDTDNHNLIVNIGAGGQKIQYIKGKADSSRGIGYLGFEYTGKLTDTTTLSEELSIRRSRNDTISESITALEVAMTKNLSLSLQYTVDHNTDVSEGIKKTNTKTSINIVGNF